MSDVVDLGKFSEQAIQEGLDRAFGSDFVFRSPRRADVAEEATDVLVLFDDVAIIVESKARAYRPGTPWRDSNTNWARKNVKAALDQLARAVRLFRAGKFAPVENARRQAVEIDPSKYPSIYGLVIVNHDSDSYDATQLVPEVEQAPVPTIVLSLADLMGLSQYLDAPYDLINYLEARYSIDHPNLQSQVHREKPAFEFYAANFEQIVAARIRDQGGSVDEASLARQGELWRQALTGNLEDARFGRFFDHMLGQLHKSTDFAPELGFALPTRDYSEAATRLAKYGRLRRIGLGKRMVECIQEAAKGRSGRHFRTYSPRNQVGLLFLASKRPDDERKLRTEDLLHLTALAHTTMPVRETIGLATEARTRGTHSFDIVIVNFDQSRIDAAARNRAHILADKALGRMGKRLSDGLE